MWFPDLASRGPHAHPKTIISGLRKVYVITGLPGQRQHKSQNLKAACSWAPTHSCSSCARKGTCSMPGTMGSWSRPCLSCGPDFTVALVSAQGLPEMPVKGTWALQSVLRNWGNGMVLRPGHGCVLLMTEVHHVADLAEPPVNLPSDAALPALDKRPRDK